MQERPGAAGAFVWTRAQAGRSPRSLQGLAALGCVRVGYQRDFHGDGANTHRAIAVQYRSNIVPASGLIMSRALGTSTRCSAIPKRREYG